MDNLIWLDLEMTGLNPDIDLIIEIATVVTDANLNVLADGPNMAIHQSEDILCAMDDWNKNQHGKSGLLERVRASKFTVEQAQEKTLAFLEQYVSAGTSPMCGNSIYQDRIFIRKWMPRLHSFFHYRNLDVSSVKILAQNWQPSLLDKFSKSSTHLAKQDVYDSIEELRFYREHFFK